ncbi:MAG: ABC transporter substrate-binding protein [Streptosporangiales bacterium]|nr:ABC transporter substrate-binding protein [Streptosporangiales bacterium]
MKTQRLAALLAVPLLALAACSGSGGGSPAPQVQTATADDRPVKRGGTLTVALDADPDALDPTTATTLVGRQVFANMCEKLYDIDANAELVPQLAAALPEVSDDGKTLTIKLREGVKFNDGTELDADAVKTSLDRHRTLAESARAAELESIEEVEVVDPATVRLTLSRPYTPMTAHFADRSGMIMSPKALEEEGDDFGANPVCVGPFKFASRTSGSEIVLDRAPDYYDAAKVKADKVVYKIIVDPNVRAANLKSGDVNVASRLGTPTVAGIQADPKLRVVSGGGLGYYGMRINIGNVDGSTEEYGKIDTPLGSNPQLREAFELSLNRQAINKAVFNGLHQPDCSPLPLDSTYRAKGFTCTPNDPARAKQLVQQSGVPTPIKVTLSAPNDTQNQRLAQVIQQMVKPAGFDVQVKTAEFVTTLEEAEAGNFDTLLNGWSGRVDPDGNLTNQVTTGDSNNYSGMSDPGIDDPIAKAAETADVAERTKLYDQSIKKAAELRGVIYLYHLKEYLGTQRNIAGIQFFQDGLPRLKTAGYAQ